MSNTLPDLPYAYDALEPYISKQIMELHHKKHHQTYVNALNAAEASYAKASTPKERIALQAALKFNGGGHINHSLFWKNLAPSPEKGGNGGVLKAGPLKEAIEASFGSLENLKKEFNAATLGIQGSGWGWLGLNPTTKRLELATTPNQDPLLSLVPLIGVDIWEHAFYLQYLNVKADYLNAIWSVINFDEAEKRLLEVSKL
ncbi:mitochondrial manganese superoxide dismutase [Mycena sp. CBHHK59/15]|nr:mitochondrial manganese superoxide dismutase [Mycena sp. CBHHK59/15]KAJ6630479.1 mitochondrial manganese superoxide dismutase [Mycena sp. CBHHK59/15]